MHTGLDSYVDILGNSQLHYLRLLILHSLCMSGATVPLPDSELKKYATITLNKLPILYLKSSFDVITVAIQEYHNLGDWQS